jgi:hypothetical protein
MTKKKTKPWNEIQKRKARMALRHLHAAGRSLRDCSHPMRLGRPATELLRLAVEAGLVFSDHIEIALEAQRQAESS